MRVAFHCITCIFLLTVNGCAASAVGSPVAPPAPSSSPTHTTLSTPTTGATILPDIVTPIATSTNVSLPSGWQRLEWQNLLIPLPPQAQWSSLVHAEAGIPIIARGAVTYPTITGTVELPFGPTFTIYAFTGSLDQWLKTIPEQTGEAIDLPTLRTITIAKQPAKVYQPVVTGTCNQGVYVLRLDTSRLLEIRTDCLDSEPYNTIIKQLELTAH